MKLLFITLYLFTSFGHFDLLLLFFISQQTASGLFQELDDRINYVATKVVHLGDQLEGINTPRSRALEAQELMKYFDEFATGKLNPKVFSDQFEVCAKCWQHSKDEN